MRGRVCRALRDLHAIAVENHSYPGTPDVNYCEGWIELKWLRHWPSHEHDIVTIPHYTQQQRIWIISRWRAGGEVYILLKISTEWLLFTGEQAYDVGKIPRSVLRKRALKIWTEGLVDSELLSILRQGRYGKHDTNKPGTASSVATSEELASATSGKALQSNNPAILPLGKRHRPFPAAGKSRKP